VNKICTRRIVRGGGVPLCLGLRVVVAPPQHVADVHAPPVPDVPPPPVLFVPPPVVPNDHDYCYRVTAYWVLYQRVYCLKFFFLFQDIFLMASSYLPGREVERKQDSSKKGYVYSIYFLLNVCLKMWIT
jgi:hypothetical protein